jgi:hypothetical protein
MLRILALAALAMVAMSGSAHAQAAWTQSLLENGKYRVSTVTLTSGTTPSAILQIDQSAITAVHAASAGASSPTVTIRLNADVSATAAGAISPTLLNAVSVTTPFRSSDIGVARWLQATTAATGTDSVTVRVYELLGARQPR